MPELLAWTKGYRSGLTSAWLAVVFVEEADRMLELCRVPGPERKAIWRQAGDDVRAEHPDLPALVQRALAARRIKALLCERLRGELEPVGSERMAAE